MDEARDRKAELEQALEDLANANRQLVLANERMTALRLIAEEAQKAKAAFVAKVSHEFRAPLNMIIGLVGLMVDTPQLYAEELPPDLWKDLEIVHRNCEHLSSMVNDVLDLSQAEAGRLTLHKEQADLAEVIDSTLAVICPLVEKKQLALQVTLPDDLPEVHCDRRRIRQVILNLMSNAARFTEKGGITVQVTKQDGHLVIGVTDTGPGISPEDAERIFEPFYQGSSDYSGGAGGSGLGLSISKQFIELHGGRIWLESDLGVGTTFYFQLPLAPPAGHIVRPGHQIRADWVWRERAFRTGGARIADEVTRPRLVVCDETGTLYRELKRFSDEVEFVDTQDLAHAVQELRQCPAHALVLNAATADGLPRLVEAARQEVPGTPIVGCSVPQPVEHALASGALGYLTKPVTRADLEGAIQAVEGPVRRVLLVDDEPDVLRLWSRMLNVMDGEIDVVAAFSSERALEELRTSLPDLMLLDILMPGTNGWQLLKLMKQNERTKQVPVFFVSAQDYLFGILFSESIRALDR